MIGTGLWCYGGSARVLGCMVDKGSWWKKRWNIGLSGGLMIGRRAVCGLITFVGRVS